MNDLREFKLKFSQPGRPLYVVVREAVKEAIQHGRFAPGQQLPSTKELSAQLDVSLVTVHRALQELVAMGVLRRRQGRGTFVHESFETRGNKTRGLRAGLVFHAESSLADPYHSQILEGVRQQAGELGVDLVLLRFGEDLRNECHGYIYVNPFPEQLDRPLRNGKVGPKANTGLPIVVVGARSPRVDVASVDTDNTEIGRSAVRAFVDRGHTRIGYVGGTGRVSNDDDRWQGFAAACRDAGLATDDAAFSSMLVRHNGWRLDEARQRDLNDMLRRADRPTAIFAAGYYFALNVYEAARAVGLSIPNDLAVIGVDDPPSAAHLSPALTTFRQPLLKIGRMAVTELFEQVLGRDSSPQRVTLSAELIERDSAARDPAAVVTPRVSGRNSPLAAAT